jgi:hypothetical protein
MFRVWLALTAVSLGACDSPQLVSFNTPELCEDGAGSLGSFTSATERCGVDCTLCVETEVDERALTYFVSHENNCVCAAPKQHRTPDAGRVAPEAQASYSQARQSDTTSAADASPQAPGDGGRGASVSDAGSGGSPHAADSGVIGAPGPDGCHSRLHLTKSEARAQCTEWDDCHVCIERVDIEGDARSYMAHQCGCPDAYRIDPN